MGNRRKGKARMLGVRVPDDLVDRLHRRADLLGVSFSDYVRWTLRKAAPPDLEAPVPLDMKEDWTPAGGREEVLEDNAAGWNESEGKELERRRKRIRPTELKP